MKTPVKPGQRKFLLNIGYTEEEIDNMSCSSAHYIISEEEQRRAKEREKERLEEERNSTYTRECLICGEYTEISYDEMISQPVSICNHCREAVMRARQEFNLF